MRHGWGHQTWYGLSRNILMRDRFTEIYERDMSGGSPSMLIVGQLLVFGTEAMRWREWHVMHAFFRAATVPFRAVQRSSFSFRLHVQDSNSGSMMRPDKCRQLLRVASSPWSLGGTGVGGCMKCCALRRLRGHTDPDVLPCHRLPVSPSPSSSIKKHCVLPPLLLQAITIPCPNRPR